MTTEAAVASASSSTADGDVVLVFEPSASKLERQKRPGKKNLPKEAYDILRDYFVNVSQYPKKHEKLELAARVNSVPGCQPDSYTAKNVECYFANLRQRHAQTSTIIVKRELVEEPLSMGAGELATNGVISEHNAASISTAPRKKKRKSLATTVVESQSMALATSAQHPLSSATTDGSISGLSAPSAKANQKKRTRLKAEGYGILNDFFTNVSRYPTAAQKAELLAAVTAMKGCEGYTVTKLTAYFSRMRIERKEPVLFVKAESPDSQFNAALPSNRGSPSGSSLAHPSLPELEPTPDSEAHPPLPAAHSSLTIRLPPFIPQKSLPPTPPTASPSYFNVFSVSEPVVFTPTSRPQPQPQNPPFAASDPPTETRSQTATEPDPVRHSSQEPAIPPSSVTSEAATVDAPTTPPDAVAGIDEPALVPVAVVEPKPDSKLELDQSLPGMSTVDTGPGDLAEASASGLAELDGGDAVLEPTSESADRSLPEIPNVDAATGDPTEPATPSSLLTLSGGDKQDCDPADPDIPMDDVPQHLEAGHAMHDDEFSDRVHTQIPAEEERTDARNEADVEHAERDSELVAEPELTSNSKLDEPMCKVVSDALAAQAETPAPALPVPDGEDKDSSDQALPEVLMDDVHGYSRADSDAAARGSSGGNGLEDDRDTPMDVDPDCAPSVVQVDVLGLAAQLQRVFSKPSTLDDDHPTTFADFATWLETRNVGLLCASS